MYIQEVSVNLWLIFCSTDPSDRDRELLATAGADGNISVLFPPPLTGTRLHHLYIHTVDRKKVCMVVDSHLAHEGRETNKSIYVSHIHTHSDTDGQ